MRSITKTAPILLLCLLASPTWAEQDDSATLVVQVEKIKDLPGELGIALFHAKKGFPTKMERSYEAAWIPLRSQTLASHTFEGLAPGEYAVSVFHDKNGDRLLDRTALGYPKEGVGFSNGCRVETLAPRFKKCRFSLSASEEKRVVIPMEYEQ